MESQPELTDEEAGHLARILLASTRVRERHHFFSWVHGPLQSLIPHEILLCGVSDAKGQFSHQLFTACRYFRDDHFQRVCDPVSGLLAQLARDWQKNPRPQMLVPAADASPQGWHARLVELELKNVAYHGLRWMDGESRGYVSFSRVGIPFDARLARYLEILLPSVLTTLARVLASERRGQAQAHQPGILTAREMEVLRWVSEGKTNDEIAAILGLSMLTVKNHLRNAMRKLRVRTRGQAVTQAIFLGLLKDQSATPDALAPERNAVQV